MPDENEPEDLLSADPHGVEKVDETTNVPYNFWNEIPATQQHAFGRSFGRWISPRVSAWVVRRPAGAVLDLS